MHTRTILNSYSKKSIIAIFVISIALFLAYLSFLFVFNASADEENADANEFVSEIVDPQEESEATEEEASVVDGEVIIEDVNDQSESREDQLNADVPDYVYLTPESQDNWIYVDVSRFISSTPELKYSFDKNIPYNQWENLPTTESTKLTIPQGKTIYLAGYNPNGISINKNEFAIFRCDKGEEELKIDENKAMHCGGNIMTLLDVIGQRNDVPYCCFYWLFGGTPILETPSMPATVISSFCYFSLYMNCFILERTVESLPATKAEESCYNQMYRECRALENMPILPATELAPTCYRCIFHSCESLNETSMDVLPATVLKDNCYRSMFYGCKKLKRAPELPATQLAQGCYQYMFESCSSLTSTVELPATTLADDCYSSMFKKCTSLPSFIDLPATTLAKNCYDSMFWECNFNNETIYLPATELKPNCYTNMFSRSTIEDCTFILPASQLSQECYSYMFRECHYNANTTLIVLFTDWREDLNATQNWFQPTVFPGSPGVFVCPDELETIQQDGDYNHIYSGWTVEKLKELTPECVNVSCSEFVYDGQVKTIDVTVGFEGEDWTERANITGTTSATDPGEYTFMVSPKYEFESSNGVVEPIFYGTVTGTWTILPPDPAPEYVDASAVTNGAQTSDEVNINLLFVVLVIAGAISIFSRYSFLKK